MFQRIVVPLDGSACAEQTISVAARLARVSGGSIILVHVVLPPVDFGKYTAPRLKNSERVVFEKNRARATSYLASMLLNHTGDLAGIDVDMGVAIGLVPEAICSVACKEQADLILLSSKEQSGMKRWLFGSIAQEIVDRSSVPVFVMNAQSVIPRLAHSAYPLQAQVILDGSSLSEALIQPVAQLLTALAAPTQGILHLVRILDHTLTSEKGGSQSQSDSVLREFARQEAEKYLSTIVDHLYKGPLASPGLIVTTSVVNSTDMTKTIIDMAEESTKTDFEGACNLIALTMPGHRKLRHLVAGSIFKHILGATRLSILTSLPQAIAAQSGIQ